MITKWNVIQASGFYQKSLADGLQLGCVLNHWRPWLLRYVSNMFYLNVLFTISFRPPSWSWFGVKRWVVISYMSCGTNKTNEPFYKSIKQSKTSRNNCFPSRLAGESQEGGFVGARRLSWWRDAGADSGHSVWQIFCRLSHFITSYNISAACEVWRQEEGKVRRSAQLFVWHIYSQHTFYLIV